MASENGWEPSHAPADLLEWVTVPGTDVHLQFMKGWPSTVMRAYAADYHAYIEPLRDADSASFTPTNSVATSNHLNGTAMDLNWNSHPFQVNYAGFDSAKIARMRELLTFYNFEGLQIMFWAQDWQSPKDAMHHQMGYNTWNNPKVLAFINSRIRPDGFSTYKRGGTVPPPPPPALSRADRYALLIIAEGRRLGITPRGIMIALAVGLVETNLTNYANSNDPPSLNLPHDAVGSDHMSVGWAQQQPPWGPLADRMDITRAATLFFICDNGPGVRGLTKIRERINREDGALYDYNDVSRSPGFYAQKVQGSAFPDRYDQRFNDAVAIYNRLATGAPPPPPPPPPIPGDDMALVPQAQWDAFYHAYMDDLPSLSPLRKLGEGNVGPLHKFIRWMDANTHIAVVKLLAGLGSPDTLRDLQELAAADLSRYPDRADGKELANNILADIQSNPQAVVQQAAQELQIPAAPQIVYLPAPEPVAAAPASVNGDGDTGQVIGDLYRALDRLRLADALPIEARAPLGALISVLTTKNGSQL